MSVSHATMSKLQDKYGIKSLSQYEDKIVSKLTSCSDSDKFVIELATDLNIPENIRCATREFFGKIINSCGKRIKGNIDIVFWNCVSEYPLLEFYRRIMSFKDPEAWALPNTISFIGNDISVQRRCEEMAKILFPMIVETKTIFLQDDDYSAMTEEDFPNPSCICPRVHFFLDRNKICGEKATAIAQTLKRICVRHSYYNEVYSYYDENYLYYNEIFCGVSGIHEFLVPWHGVAINCGEAVLCCNNPSLELIAKHRIFLDSEKELERLGVKKEERIKILRTLSRKTICVGGCENVFWDVFKYVERGRMINNREHIRYLAFYPKYGDRTKICLLKIGPFRIKESRNNSDRKFDDKLDIARHWLTSCAGKTAESYIDHLTRAFYQPTRGEAVRNLMKVVCVYAWNPQTGQIECSISDQDYGESWDTDSIVDLREMLGVVDANASPLPSVDSIQKGIVFDRRQFMKIRGGPGTGKTVTMLWHGVSALENHHLPVLILTKTNTLSSANLKRFAVSYATRNNCDVDHVREQIHFLTMSRFLCVNARNLLPNVEIEGEKYNCLRQRCSLCCKRMGEGKGFNEYQSCEYFQSGDSHCKVYRKLSNNVPCNWALSESDKGSCCDACIASLCLKLFLGELELSCLTNSAYKYGCVLVDEAQGLTADELQASYLITGGINRWREYYMFCDEEQRL